MLPHPILLVFFTILGLAIGSFLNLIIDRLPAGKSIISPRSHCPACQHGLKTNDLVPLFSYLWLKGHCRYCHTSIPKRLPIVEAATGLLFPLLYWHYGLNPMLGFSLVYACLLIIIFVIDIEHQLILDKVVYPGIGLALILSPFYPALGIDPGPRVISAISGGSAGLAILLIPFLLSRGGMGMGDIKMAVLLGLITGFPQVFIALFLSIMAGGIVAVFLLTFGLKKRKQPIPFGPFLAAGTMATIIWGAGIQQWYQQILIPA